jgi:hypothetical protein
LENIAAKHDQIEQSEGELLVFGDSHSILWEGNIVPNRTNPKFPKVKVFHLGPALAFNLLNNEGTGLGKWGELIFGITNDLRAQGTQVRGIMLSFGEIDARTQVVYRALREGLTILESAKRITDRLMLFAKALYETYNVPVLLWEPVPSTGSKQFLFNPVLPAVGSESERNFGTECFAVQLRQACAQLRSYNYQIYSFGVFEDLTSFYETKPEYFEDGCHLNLRGLDIALRNFKKMCEEHDLDLDKFFHRNQDFARTPTLQDLAPRGKLTLSSEAALPSQVTRSARGFCFHTMKEPRPHAIVDIGYASVISKVIIYNRFDDCFERAKTLQVLVGNDLKQLRVIHQSDQVWGTDGMPLSLEVDASYGSLRYVAFQLMEEQYLHLGEIQVIASTFLG